MGRVLQFRGKAAVETPVFIDVNPSTLCWCIQTYHDTPALARCLRRLRKVYPASRIMVISDGDTNARLPALCGQYRAQFVMGERLFTVEHGGEIVHRMLDFFLKDESSDVLIKIDPDTVIRRPLKKILSRAANAIAGSVITSAESGDRAIQGGCVFIPRSVAQNWVDNQVFRAEVLKPPTLAWALSQAARDRAAAGLTSHDWTLAWACREHDVQILDHPEVRSFWKFEAYKYGAMRSAAVSHPEFGWREALAGMFFIWELRLRAALNRMRKKP